ncbi:MAG: glycosyltransferase family 2 protein [Anaerolineales bacterium]|nr:glycosyltransferase family 2 protein [Anaerolineales bacterium]
MNSDLFFSVVVPLYNKEQHIKRAVLSVLDQNFIRYELLIVDDGSTDNSYEVAKSIEDDRIRIIRQSNQGECAARNRGILESSSEFIAFLDADDCWKPSFLDQIASLIKEYPTCGVYATSYEVVDEFGVCQPLKKSYFVRGWRGILDNYFEIIRDYFPFNSSSVAIRKEALKKVNGFPVGVKLGGDIATWFNLCTVTKFAYVNLPFSTIHYDAENRVTMTYKKPLNDYAPITTLSNLTRNGKLSLQNTQHAINYLAKKQLPIVRHYLENGDSLNARKALSLCKGTTRYAKAWRKYYLYSWLPSRIGQWAIKNRP